MFPHEYGFRPYILGRNTKEVIVCPSQRIPSGFTRCHFVPLLVMLTWAAWLKSYLPRLSAVKVLFSPLSGILSGRVGGHFEAVEISCCDSNSHTLVLAPTYGFYLTIIIIMVDKW